MRHRAFRIGLGIFVTLTLCAAADAQTANDSSPTWDQVVHTVTAGFVAGDVEPLASRSSDEIQLEAFDDPTSSADRLLRLASGATIVSLRAYDGVPMSFASDLAADFNAVRALPDPLRKEMTPDDGAMLRANVIAAQWIVQVLDPQETDRVAAIVLWTPPAPSTATLRSIPTRPVFILVKGAKHNDAWQITRLVFGDPLDAVSR